MELFKCRFCGSPYAYRENLELHEKSCPKRPATQPVSRYTLPVGLQREWIGARERLFAEGKRDHEWGAGLYLKDGLIYMRDFIVGMRPLELPLIDLRKDLRPIGTVHYHPRGTGPDFDDWIEWIFLAARQIPEGLRPLFIVTLPDDTFHAYMLPFPETVQVRWMEEWGKRERIRRKVVHWGEKPDNSASIDAHYGMVQRRETKIWRRPKLGLFEQFFVP